MFLFGVKSRLRFYVLIPLHKIIRQVPGGKQNGTLHGSASREVELVPRLPHLRAAGERSHHFRRRRIAILRVRILRLRLELRAEIPPLLEIHSPSHLTLTISDPRSIRGSA